MGASELEQLVRLSERVRSVAKEFHNSTPVASYRVEPLKHVQGVPPDVWAVSYDIKDVLLVAAVTETPVLMVGATDSGKTTLARLVLNALFGQENKGWAKLDVDTEFSQESIAATDFSAVTEGKTSEELYSVLPKLKLPGLIIDEMNRTDPRIAAKLLHIVLEKDVAIGGTRAALGAEISGGRRYQFQIAAVNQGYKGTFEVDEALLRRTVMELPMDMFPPTMLDRSRINRSPHRHIPLTGNENHLDDVVAVMDAAAKLGLSREAEHFLLYLEAMESCVYSPTLMKGGIESRSGNSLKYFCSHAGQSNIACRFLNSYANEFCPNVRGLSPGVSQNLVILAKGFAAMRGAKSLAKLREGSADALAEFDVEMAIEAVSGHLQVEPEDLKAAVPFVGYSKMGISAEWVQKMFKTSRWHAIKGVVEAAHQKFNQFYLQHAGLFLQMKDGGTANITSEAVTQLMQKAFDEDHFMFQSLIPYFAERFPSVMKIQEIAYRAR